MKNIDEQWERIMLNPRPLRDNNEGTYYVIYRGRRGEGEGKQLPATTTTTACPEAPECKNNSIQKHKKTRKSTTSKSFMCEHAPQLQQQQQQCSVTRLTEYIRFLHGGNAEGEHLHPI